MSNRVKGNKANKGNKAKVQRYVLSELWVRQLIITCQSELDTMRLLDTAGSRSLGWLYGSTSIENILGNFNGSIEITIPWELSLNVINIYCLIKIQKDPIDPLSLPCPGKFQFTESYNLPLPLCGGPHIVPVACSNIRGGRILRKTLLVRFYFVQSGCIIIVYTSTYNWWSIEVKYYNITDNRKQLNRYLL